MLLTLYYMAATWIQSWRLGAMRSKILLMLSRNESLVLSKEPPTVQSDVEGNSSLQLATISSSWCVNKNEARVGDLVWFGDNKRGCSLFPTQRLDVTRWISFHGNKSLFPIEVSGVSQVLLRDDLKLHLLIEADYCSTPGGDEGNCCHVRLEDFGVPRAWRADELMGIIMETDVENFAKLGTCFMNSRLLMDDGMELVRLETVCVEGRPCLLLNVDSIPVVRRSWAMTPDRWRTHMELLANLSGAADRAVEEGGQVAVPGYDWAVVTTGDMALEMALPVKTTTVSNPAAASLPPGSPASLAKVGSASIASGSTTSLPTVSAVSLPQDSTASLLPGSTASLATVCTTSAPSGSTASLPTGPAASLAPRPSDGSPDSMYSITMPSTVEASPVRQLISEEERAGSSADSFCSMDSTSTASVAAVTAHTRPLKVPPMKPPNVLVYSESPAALENVKAVLQTVLHPSRYTVYGLTQDQLLSTPWADNTHALVVWGSVSDRLGPELVNYLLAGGKLLCLCSDLLLRVLPSFKTAEVREKELVRFSYSRWKQVPLMHDVFCYQASPSHARFTDDKSLPVPTSVEMPDCDGVSRTLEVKVLGCEETWHTPSLLLATVRGTGGQVVFSQIHLEQEPSQYEVDESKWGSLYESEVARIDILRDLLGTHLGLACAESNDSVPYTPAYFLGLFELKQEFLGQLQDSLQPGGILKLPDLSLQLCGKGVQPTKATASLMPLLLHACPEHFSTVEYFENLKSKSMGRLVVYSEVMTSSMRVVAGPPLYHGLAVVPVQQTHGVGRSHNKWLSPRGCAMFTLQVHVPTNSYLGQHIPLLQHIAALAVVKGIRELPGYERLDLRLKWPNDIYVGSTVKIGGLIVNSTLNNNMAVCNIGCGVNLNNEYPTLCINAAIKLYNKTSNEKELQQLSFERYLALVFTELEQLIERVQGGGVQQVLHHYYKYWLHSEAHVTVSGKPVTIVGIDDYGFLLVRGLDGVSFAVQPDGNTFDMLHGLIAPKAL